MSGITLPKVVSYIANMICPDYSETAKRYWRYREKALEGGRLTKGYYKLRAKREAHRFGALIPICRNISPFEAPHGLLGIVINRNATVGKECVIFHQVTIGTVNTESKHSGVPIIGNNVFIGAGAKIIGGVTIGDNVKIGANCVVVEDIPPSCTVVMNKPRIISNNNEH